MKPLIEDGYLYIAQPPLYKAKIGKKEQYLKDERAFNKFLFDWIRDQGTLSIDGSLLEKTTWHSLLDTILKYQERLEEIAQKFRLSQQQCHALVGCMYKTRWHEDEGISELVNKVQECFKDSLVDVLPPKEVHEGEQMVPAAAIRLRKLNNDWTVKLDFFSSHDLEKLLELYKPLAVLEQPWTLHITDKDKEITDQGIYPFMQAVIKISKPYLSVQRYKGLGEMNPDQLGETAMDAQSRSLLQVSIGDALEADTWFDTLMGDDVTGRREFIEENGRFANLDV